MLWCQQWLTEIAKEGITWKKKDGHVGGERRNEPSEAER